MRVAIKKDVFWYSAGSMTFALNTMLMLVLVSRNSNVVVTGEFGIAFTTAQLLYIIGLFGVNTYQMTDYNKQYSFQDYFNAKLLTSLLMIVLCAGLIMLTASSPTRIIYTSLLTVFTIINSFSEVFQSLLFQENQLEIAGKSLFFRTTLSFLAFAVTLYITKNIVVSLILINIVNIIATLYFAILPSRKYMDFKPCISRTRIISLLKECLPLCVSLFLMTFMVNSSKYVIDFYGYYEMQGYFNIIFIPAQVINLFSGFIFKPLLNEFAQSIAARENDTFFLLLRRQVALIATLTVSFSVGCGFLGPSIMGVIFNVDLSGFALELALIVVSGGFLALSALFYYLLVILRQQKAIFWTYILCCAISILFGVIFIKSWGILGAATAFLLSYLLLAIIFSVILVECLKKDKTYRLKAD